MWANLVVVSIGATVQPLPPLGAAHDASSLFAAPRRLELLASPGASSGASSVRGGGVRRYHHRRRRRYNPGCEQCCGEGAYRLFLNTADSYCEPCPADHYWPPTRPGTVVFDCVPCPAGRHQPVKGQTSCRAAGQGGGGGGDDAAPGGGGGATAAPNALRIGAPAPRSAAAAVAASSSDCTQLAFVVDSIVDVSRSGDGSGGSGGGGKGSGFASYVATRVALRAALAKVVDVQLEQVTVAAAPREEVTLQPGPGVAPLAGGAAGAAAAAATATTTNRFRAQLFVADSETALGLVELFKMQHFDHALQEIAPTLRFESSFSKVMRIAHARRLCKGGGARGRLGAGGASAAAAADAGALGGASAQRIALARELVVSVAALALVAIFVVERRKLGLAKGKTRYSRIQAQHSA